MPTEPLFTPEQIKQDGQNRVARTVGQTGIPGAVITVVDYLLQTYLHQDPLPPAVVVALGLIGAGLAAWFTNLPRLRGEDGHGHPDLLVLVLVVVVLVLVVGYLGRP